MWRFLDAHFEDLLGALMLAVMVTVAFINVIVRYFTSFSFAWSEEITVNFFVWVVLLGSARAFREGSNLCMNLFYDALPRPLRLLCYLAGFLICILFFAVLGWTGVLEILDEADLEVTSESLAIPVWLYTSCTPLLSLLTIFRILQRGAEVLRLRKY